jgi:hypothetical protein
MVEVNRTKLYLVTAYSKLPKIANNTENGSKLNVPQVVLGISNGKSSIGASIFINLSDTGVKNSSLVLSPSTPL